MGTPAQHTTSYMPHHSYDTRSCPPSISPSPPQHIFTHHPSRLFLAAVPLAVCIQPSSHVVGNIIHVTWCSAFRIVQVALVDFSRVVASSCCVDVSILVDALDQPI